MLFNVCLYLPSFPSRHDWRKSDSSVDGEPQGNWRWNSNSRGLISGKCPLLFPHRRQNAPESLLAGSRTWHYEQNERENRDTTPLRIKVIHALYYSALVYHVSCIEHGNGHKNKQINKTNTHKTKKTCGTILSMKEQAIY